MGQCISTPTVGGETEQAYRAKWEGGGALADGLPAYQDNKYTSPSPPPKRTAYTTTADVGITRTKDQYAFLHGKAPLPSIIENHSLQHQPTASPARQPANTPSRPAHTPIHQNRDPVPSRIPANWTKGELIGQGAFGSVYLGMDTETGQLMAVKQVSLAKKGGPQMTSKLAEHIKTLEDEVQLLQNLSFPNIVCYLGTESTGDALNIFLEYVPGGSIASLVARFGCFSESVVRVYTRQILMGLEYLHSNGIIHRDIKGANILVDNTGLVKLADFGASKRIEDIATMESGFKSVKGTPYWMAPEVIQATGHERPADIWSVACTVIEMATGKPPWSQYGIPVSAMFHIAKSKGPPTIPENLSPDCKDFLYLCFNRNWRQRPTATQLLQHPFLAEAKCSNQNAIPSAGVVHPEQSNIPAYRAKTPGGVAPSPSAPSAAAGAGADLSPVRQGHIANNNNNNPGMSPLAAHLSNNLRGNGNIKGTTTPAGPRRQLNLDSVAEDSLLVESGGGGGGGRRHSEGTRAQQQQQQQQQAINNFSSSPSKRPAMMVMASAPVFANLRDSSCATTPCVGSGGGRMPRTESTPRMKTPFTAATAAAERENNLFDTVALSSQDQQQQQQYPQHDEAENDSSALTPDMEATLMVPDPATLGSLRRSNSSLLSRSRSTSRGGVGRVFRTSNDSSSAPVPASAPPTSVSQDQLQSSVPSTVMMMTTSMMSSELAVTDPLLMDTVVITSGSRGCSMNSSDATSASRASTASTAQQQQQQQSSGGGGGGGTTTTTTTTSRSSRGGASVASYKSEFNPMEEPAWMAGGAAAAAAAQGSLNSKSAHHGAVNPKSSFENKNEEEEEEETVSIKPQVSAGGDAFSSRPSSGGSTTNLDAIAEAAATLDDVDAMPPPPSRLARNSTTTSLQQSASTSSGTAHRTSSSSSSSRGRGGKTTSGSGSEGSGPVVYTVETEESLPWDVVMDPPHFNTTATTTTTTTTTTTSPTAFLGTATTRNRVSDSLSSWKGTKPTRSTNPITETAAAIMQKVSRRKSDAPLPSVSSLNSGSSAHLSDGDALSAEPVDQDAILGALRQQAQHTIRASMALFAAQKATSSSTTSGSGTTGGASGGASEPPLSSGTIKKTAAASSASLSSSSGSDGSRSCAPTVPQQQCTVEREVNVSKKSIIMGADDEDASEVTSPPRQRPQQQQQRLPTTPSTATAAPFKCTPSRIPRAPESSPVKTASSSAAMMEAVVASSPAAAAKMAKKSGGGASIGAIIGDGHLVSVPSTTTSSSRRLLSSSTRTPSVVPASPAATPSKLRGGGGGGVPPATGSYLSPTKRQIGGGGGSYEQQLRARQQSSGGGSTTGYGARAGLLATPSKSVANHPLRTPSRTPSRGDGINSGRPSSAAAAVTMTPRRRQSSAV